MDINAIKCNIHNKFDIEVIDGKTGEVKERAEAYNMVLDNLWHYIIETTTAFGTAIQYGSGTGTISASDTSLFNRANGISVTQDSLNCDYENKVIIRRCHINLALSTSVGVNITEVGLAAGTGNGTLTTHAMLQDMNGNPISIAKTEFDIINIYATIYCHWTITDPNIAFYPRNNNLLNSLTGGTNIFGSFTGGFGHSNCNIQETKTWSKTYYSTVTKTMTYTVGRYTQSEGNISGGLRWLLGSDNYNGIGLKKDTNTWSSFNIVNESVGTGDGTTTSFKTKFNEPYNAYVYINGVVQSSGVTVYKIESCENEASNSSTEIIADHSTDNNIIYAPVGDWDLPATVIIYNANYANENVSQIACRRPGSYSIGGTLTVYKSSDLITWTQILQTSVGSPSNRYDYANIPTGEQNNKYYKIVWQVSNSGNLHGVKTSNTYNIVFDVPPADGDVITIDYTTDCIPKDSDHVLDATITFQFGDYIPSP